jgi:thiopurine S-methyltransferase
VGGEYWLDRWRRKAIGFHESQANPLLVTHFASLSLPPASRIFVPLCGKTLDIQWLLARGHQIVGAELSEIAVQELFAGLGLIPSLTPVGSITRYGAPGIEVFQGDIFALSRGKLGPVAAIYDKAALIALPESMRARYATHIERLTECARQLIICLDYDQRLLAGPPFSVDGAELERLYRPAYDLRLLASGAVEGGLKGKCPATEDVWLLTPAC